MDEGYTWQEIAEVEGDVLDIAALSQDTVYAGIRNFWAWGGGVSRSTDEGDTWENIGLGLHYVAALDINSSGDLYAGSTDHHHYGYGGVYKLEHGADTWDTLSFWPRVKSMVITQEDIIYCGFYDATLYGGGVIQSDNGGETWVMDTTGMGNHSVYDLVLDNNERLYALAGYVYTNLYRTSLPVSIEPQSDLKPERMTYCVPNPFSYRAKIYFDKPLKNSADLRFNLYSLGGLKIVARALNSNEMEKAMILFDRNNLAKGIYSYTISGTGYYCAGRFIVN